MAKQLIGLAQLCEALGVERPNEVLRVVVDIDSKVGYPVLYVERIGDAGKIVAALTDPGIDLRIREQANAPTFDSPETHDYDPQCHCHVCSAHRWRQGRKED